MSSYSICIVLPYPAFVLEFVTNSGVNESLAVEIARSVGAPSLIAADAHQEHCTGS
jgi:hypothetical protein